MLKLRIKLIIGQIINSNLLRLLDIDLVDFNNNLKPSASTCKNPQMPTTVGPCLLCNPANIFRSAIVNKATAKSAGIKADKVKKNNFKLVNDNSILIYTKANLQFYLPV